jgi:hypothetical protein
MPKLRREISSLRRLVVKQGLRKKEEAQQWNRVVRLPLWWDWIAPVLGRLVSFVMT